MELIDQIFYRKINPSDFRNMFEVAKPATGGGQTYIEAAGISDEELDGFLTCAELSDSTGVSEKRYVYGMNCYVLGNVAKSAYIEFSPRKGRNYRICRQNLSNRHPAWRPDNGFPEPEKSVDGQYIDSSEFSGIIDNLIIIIIRSSYRKYYAWYCNKSSMPDAWPKGIGLEKIFEGARRGILSFEDVRLGLVQNRDNPFDGTTVDEKRVSESRMEENTLDFALQQFKIHRTDPEWAGNRGENDWTSWSVNTAAREYYGKLDAETVHAFTTEQFTELFCGVKNEEGKITFSPMWSGCPGQGWSSVKEGYESDPQKVISFLEDIAKSPAMLALFARDDFDRPKGFGKSVISELLMKFHPDCCFKYGSKTVEVLKKLELLDFVAHTDYKDTEYKRVLGIAATIKDKMTALKISRTLEDSEKPDYLTVNEFIGWVFEHEDELFKIYKEKVMSKKLKTDKPVPYEGKKELKFKPDDKEDELLLRLLSSLRAKPFAILAGHSGTGKSRYVKKLAYMTCNAKELRTEGKLPGNFLLLQVKPNWHDSTELLGIRNAMDENRYQRTSLIEFLFKAYHFKDTPFFLCLDEMNLAPVEQYFAEFLSSMESEEPVPLNDIKADEDNLFELGCEWTDAQEHVRNKGFSIPDNLFIVGTVNMDETTNQFSRKVLDRAFTIEMTDVDFTKFGVVTTPSYDDTIGEDMIKSLLSREKSVKQLDADDVVEESALVKVQKALEQTAFAVAYRFASEYTLLKRAIALFDPGNTMKLDALDQAVLMKVLPRITGEADYIRRVYGKTAGEGLRKALEGKKVSSDKIAVILKRAEEADAQSISFWP